MWSETEDRRSGPTVISSEPPALNGAAGRPVGTWRWWCCLGCPGPGSPRAATGPRPGEPISWLFSALPRAAHVVATVCPAGDTQRGDERRFAVRILVAMEHLGPFGGAPRSVLEVSEELARRGHRFVVAYREPGEFQSRWEAIADSLVPVPLRVSQFVTVRHPFRWLTSSWRSARLMQETKPDVIYCNFVSTLPFCLMLRSLGKTPVAVTVRDPTPPLGGLFTRQLLRRVDAVSFISKQQRATFERIELVPKNIPVIGLGLDPTYYRPGTPAERQAARRQFEVDDTQLVIAYAGRLDPDKGIETLFEAMAILSDPRLVAVVAGGPSTFRVHGEAYAAHVRSAAPPNVRFLGRQTDVRPLLWAADVVVVPSVFEEPAGRVPLEAMACGVPTVASRVGGIPESFPEGFESLLVRPGDPHELARVIRAVLDGSMPEARSPDSLRANVIDHFNIEALASSVECLLATALKA